MIIIFRSWFKLLANSSCALLLGLVPVEPLAQSLLEFKEIRFGERNINIELPTGYSYFEKSIYSNVKMGDFTLNSLNGLHDIEVLVPHAKGPTIHIIGFDEFKDLELMLEDFSEYKSYVKTQITKPAFDSLSDSLLEDKLFISALGGHVKIENSILKIIHDTSNRIVSALLLKVNVKEDSSVGMGLVISNYIYIKQTIIIIRFLYNRVPSNITEAVSFQDAIVRRFININLK
ncbi:MAG: hypothetical protein WC760_08265 [Bacteroidia bacterium]|jgi:hypothetical protein